MSDGIQLKRWYSSFAKFKTTLYDLLRAEALICMSPNREERCDLPATRIFFQDECELYPCCGAHFPDGQQWTGSTRMRGGQYRIVNIFAEKLSCAQVDWDPANDKIERYDRSSAT